MPATEFQKMIAEKLLSDSEIKSGEFDTHRYWRIMYRIMHQEGVDDPAARGVCGRAVHLLVKNEVEKLKGKKSTVPAPVKRTMATPTRSSQPAPVMQPTVASSRSGSHARRPDSPQLQLF